jgi:hypothetical protein
MPLTSLPGILDVAMIHGARARPDAALDLVIEIPHGATDTADFTAAAAELTSPLPEGLIEFFWVNTDAGAPELALAIAERLVADHPTRSIAVLRCRIPRTLIDCNRRTDASPADLAAGRVTAAVAPWITTTEDRARLVAHHRRYVTAVDAALAALAPHGALVMLHSYAPRTIDVEVDLQIVAALRRAYHPDRAASWPLRPEVDVIDRAADGTRHSPPRVIAALHRELSALGIAPGDSATYPLHPGTLAWDHAVAHPGRAIVLEIRRDLLTTRFIPLAEPAIDPAKVAHLAAPFARAFGAFWS